MPAASQKTISTRFSTACHPEVDPRVNDFQAFYESWYPRAVSIARRKGLRDPEAAAQEALLDCIPVERGGKGYLERQPGSQYSFDRFVANLVYRRLISLQRQELRRRDIAPMEAIGARDFETAGDLYGDFRERMQAATDLIRDTHPEFYAIWKAVVFQVLVGRATVGQRVDQYELARRARLTQAQLEAELDRFIEMAQTDHELADLLGVNRA